MFSNYLTAALRNLVRNRLYAAINLIGLAVGFAAALLIALFVRDEFSYDRFFSGHEHIYLVGQTISLPGRSATRSDLSPAEFGPLLKTDFPEIEAMTRIAPNGHSVRRGEQESDHRILWADGNLFDVLKFPVVAGSLDGALANPGSIVLTRKTAQEFFGRDDPIGETLELDRKNIMTVTAVIETLPSNTHLIGDFIAAGASSFSPLAMFDAQPDRPGVFNVNAQIYLKIDDPATAGRIEAELPRFLKRHKSLRDGFDVQMVLRPLASVHLAPGEMFVLKERGHIETILAMAAIGALIVLTASINFVNLTTARAGRRATEVGVRKVAGAGTRALVSQFIGESFVYVALGMGLALGLTALLLPVLNAFLDRTIALDLFSDGRAFGFLIGLAGIVGVLAGLYPAFVLASFRPAAVLKAGSFQSPGSVVVRQVLVVLQFALLIGLLIATGVIYRQTQFALTEAQRLDSEQVLGVVVNGCDGSFREALRSMSGITATSCASGLELGGGEMVGSVTTPDGIPVTLAKHPVGPGFFEFFGLRPLAGRFFDENRPADALSDDRDAPLRAPVVLNESAVRMLTFASPAEAIGRTTSLIGHRKTVEASEIIGVVEDFAIDAVHKAVPPIVYFVEPGRLNILYARIDGGRTPEILEDIDSAWKQFGAPRPINRFFLDRRIAAAFEDINRQSQLFAAFAGVAVFISVLGLFGMCVSIAERRVKEIGVRKVLGASRGDVVRMLVWQFTQPVLWANLIAWPVAYVIMGRWLDGFAAHIELELWLFAAAAFAAGIVAVATVTAQSFAVAGTRPVNALKYE